MCVCVCEQQQQQHHRIIEDRDRDSALETCPGLRSSSGHHSHGQEMQSGLVVGDKNALGVESRSESKRAIQHRQCAACAAVGRGVRRCCDRGHPGGCCAPCTQSRKGCDRPEGGPQRACSCGPRPHRSAGCQGFRKDSAVLSTATEPRTCRPCTTRGSMRQTEPRAQLHVTQLKWFVLTMFWRYSALSVVLPATDINGLNDRREGPRPVGSAPLCMGWAAQPPDHHTKPTPARTKLLPTGLSDLDTPGTPHFPKNFGFLSARRRVDPAPAPGSQPPFSPHALKRPGSPLVLSFLH